MNHKRIQRLWREEGLRRPVRTRKRRRRTRTEDSERLRADHPNQVWAIDFQFDATADGRQLKSLNIVDEHTREALAMRVGRTCTADEVVESSADLVAVRGAPEHLRMDNGPELIAWALRDYCRLAGTRTTYIEPGSPWENPFVESFNSRVRDELFNVEEFATLHRSPGHRRGLADRVQHLPAALLPRGISPQPSTRPPGPAPPNQHSHSGWTTQPGSRQTNSATVSESRRLKSGATDLPDRQRNSSGRWDGGRAPFHSTRRPTWRKLPGLQGTGRMSVIPPRVTVKASGPSRMLWPVPPPQERWPSGDPQTGRPSTLAEFCDWQAALGA